MHVVIAPDSFDGTLTATAAAHAIADGWRAGAPHCLLTPLPLSGGGPGFLDVLAARLPGEMIAATVEDPLGREVPASVLLTEADGIRTAYVEAAQAVGLHLLGAGERDPSVTTSYGVGQLLQVARAAGAQRIVIGTGAGATNDGGAGLLCALGAGRAADLARGGMPLAHLRHEALAALPQVAAQWAQIELIVAGRHDLPLLGLQGTSASGAVGKGASPQDAQALEGALGNFMECLTRVLPPRMDLLTARARRLDREPGSGSGGGLGFAVMALGGRWVNGPELVADATGLSELVAAADLVVTGESCFDWQSLRGSVVAQVARTALASATPAIVIATEVLVGRRETMGMGLSGSYAVASRPAQQEAAALDPVGSLRARAQRVAATWSPPPRPAGVS